jgi:hypothetical protein
MKMVNYLLLLSIPNAIISLVIIIYRNWRWRQLLNTLII